MKPHVELRHLRAFIALAAELHFGRAAERLFISQPALTQIIRQLEEELGLSLFVRTTRAVALTTEGARLLPRVQQAVSSVERVGVEAEQLRRESSGQLVVGSQIGTAVSLSTEVVREFEAAYPQYTIVFNEYDFSDPASGLDSGLSDVAFVRPPIGLEGVDMLTLYQEKRLLGVPRGHRLADRLHVTISDALAEPIIASPTPGVWRDYWLLNEYRTEPANVVLESPTFESELRAVAAGRGVIVTCEASLKYFSRPTVAFVPIEGLAPCDVAVAWSRASTHPAVRLFVSMVAERARGTDSYDVA
jgi:DNA-binding transcriptional LysR family regulator